MKLTRVLWIAAAALVAAVAAWRPCSGGPSLLFARIAPDAGSPTAPLLLSVGIHVEPLGAVPSGLLAGVDAPPAPRAPVGYRDPALFARHVADLRLLLSILEAHGARATLQVQTPFTQVCGELGEGILKDAVARGHEVGLHFHEDAHLGPRSEQRSRDEWAAVMREEIALIRDLGVPRVRYWSGGNLYSDLLVAARRAGLDVMGDFKDPRTQTADVRLLDVHPWRPAGSPKPEEMAPFARHDPKGTVIYLPDGLRPAGQQFLALQGRGPNREAPALDFWTESLERSLRAARKGRVNVLRVTVHPTEFRGADARPYALLEEWLTEVVDPLVKAEKVKWATCSQAADAFTEWERSHRGAAPREVPYVPPSYASTREAAFALSVGGDRIAGHVHWPNAAGRFPAVVLVPGGLGDGGSFDAPRNASGAHALARRGYVAVHWDPPGRGRSAGQEDFNGARGQDALAAVIRYTAKLPQFDRKSLGVMTHSLGIALGAGALARHRDLPVRYLFDVEGPSSAPNMAYRLPAGEPMRAIFGPYLPPEAFPDFWKGREPARLIGKIKARYFRFQKVMDHVHGPRHDHAAEMIDAATAGGVWCRCNDNPPNTRWSDAFRLEPDEGRLLEYLDEVARL